MGESPPSQPPGSRSGPELDARIDDPDAALVYVEAKWNAGIGTGKGKIESAPDDQVVLRRDPLRQDPALDGDDRHFIVLGVSEAKPDVGAWAEPDPGRLVDVAWLSWDELAECRAHPDADEFRRYLTWKRAASAGA